MKKCKYCNEEKEFIEFGKHIGHKDGYQSYCKICASKVGKNGIMKIKLNQKF